MDTLTSLTQLREKYPGSQNGIDNKEHSAKIANILLSLKDKEGIKMIEDRAVREIIAINNTLLIDDFISEQDRGILIAERKVWRWFVSIFPNAEKSLKNIDEYIKRYG